ncbi:heme oxygenase [Mucilaginibacter limnophilus]|uniref:Heme oxygenase n=1 Tax=Mucilaginibacter limnophilus TaxID=1932778 RepID=A0A437MLB4_9SPHI|nr:biliverdin-producing heme oxygenase [Mucilaginibacter limnophilus]RVT98396.1 heme oxygenase [Mucilaginibacter limnophilus]
MVSATIKQHTQEAHAGLEKIVVQKLKNIRDDADYAALLQYFYAYFAALEDAIAPYITGEVLVDYVKRRKSGRLLADIEELGADLNKHPDVTVPEINNAKQAMGALYVMEGSVLGGTIIVQMLAKAGITKGISFFSGYGADNGVMWKQFTTALNQVAITPDEEQEVIDSATATFVNFKQVFVAEATAISQA